MAFEVIKAADSIHDEDEVYAITSSLHEAKRSAKVLIKDGWETYITDSDSNAEWEWNEAEQSWEQVV